MKYFPPITTVFYFFLIVMISCSNPAVNEKPIKDNPAVKKQVHSKPPANFQDTLTIDSPSAVFYHPDSLQLLNIKATTDEGIFEATMHEYFYQMRNARIELTKNWPQLKIIEAKNIRVLRFKKKNKQEVFIDLNTKGDPYGLFLFDMEKDPQLADMMNIDTQVYFYLKK